MQALRTPLTAGKSLNPLSASKTFNASLSTFRTGAPLRLGASGSLRSIAARQRLSVSSAAATEVQEETHEYQAEVQCWLLSQPVAHFSLGDQPVSDFPTHLQVNRLMDMIVNSLYSNREVFIRELVSNGSDALDKIRFIGLTDRSAFETGDELEIRVKADKEAHTITIE